MANTIKVKLSGLQIICIQTKWAEITDFWTLFQHSRYWKKAEKVITPYKFMGIFYREKISYIFPTIIDSYFFDDSSWCCEDGEKILYKYDSYELLDQLDSLVSRSATITCDAKMVDLINHIFKE